MSGIFAPGWPSAPWGWIGVAWIAWLASWLVASAWSTQTAARPNYLAQVPDRLVSVIGALFLFGALHPRGSWQLWESDHTLGWSCLFGALAGIAFAWWARLHIGALWSGAVERKEGHRIVDTGPYAIVRHPIYTGIILSGLATAIARGTIDGFLGVLLFGVGFWMKARLEERFLSETLGPDYAAYRARVPMLVPFLKFG